MIVINYIKFLTVSVSSYDSFSESARQLATESRLVAENFAVCDADLSTLVQQYEQWYVDKVSLVTNSGHI